MLDKDINNIKKDLLILENKNEQLSEKERIQRCLIDEVKLSKRKEEEERKGREEGEQKYLKTQMELETLNVEAIERKSENSQLKNRLNLLIEDKENLQKQIISYENIVKEREKTIKESTISKNNETNKVEILENKNNLTRQKLEFQEKQIHELSQKLLIESKTIFNFARTSH